MRQGSQPEDDIHTPPYRVEVASTMMVVKSRPALSIFLVVEGESDGCGTLQCFCWKGVVENNILATKGDIFATELDGAGTASSGWQGVFPNSEKEEKLHNYQGFDCVQFGVSCGEGGDVLDDLYRYP